MSFISRKYTIFKSILFLFCHNKSILYMSKYITLQMYNKQKETKDHTKKDHTKKETLNHQVNKKETNEFIKIDDETLLMLFSI